MGYASENGGAAERGDWFSRHGLTYVSVTAYLSIELDEEEV